MSNILGSALGATIDRRHGNSGVKGAFLGSVAQSVLRTAISMLATAAVGLVLKNLLAPKSPDEAGGPNAATSADR